MDAFDRVWQWADKPLESPLTISAKLHRAVMGLAPERRRIVEGERGCSAR